MSLPDTLVAQPPPVEMDEDGVIRVAGTRVRLETVIDAFNNGCTPEEILLKYPSLNLTDIYAVITSGRSLGHRFFPARWTGDPRSPDAASAKTAEPIRDRAR